MAIQLELGLDIIRSYKRLLLVWLYYTNLLLLIGGELNAVLARRLDPDYKGEQGQRPAGGGSKASP